MLNIRMKKIVFIIGIITILFAIYQLSKDSPIVKEVEKSQLGKQEQMEIKLKAGTFYNNDMPNPNLLEKDYKSKMLPSLFEGQKIVHIDLKGAPLKVSFYKELFVMLRKLGATGILMEYEDMFPYSNIDISAANAYSKTDIDTILKLASENHLEVIPLVQTFGHLEFVLKLEQFKQFREVSKYPQVICPTNNKTSYILKDMIDDIIALHPKSRYLHIGCDEVYQLGECVQCMDRMLRNNWIKQQLFLSHVTMVARYVKEKYPHISVLVWDDEFRKASLEELLSSNLGSLVEPVIWKYTPTVTTDLPSDMWEKYAKTFNSVWIASAFKGATGPDKLITNISYHLENHRAWMRLVATQSNKINFKGIFITGWQRYDHFAVLCELLPVGLPSLAVNLAFLAQNDPNMEEVPHSVLQNLSCGPGLMYSRIGAHCNFPGSQIYEKAHQLDILLDQISQLHDSNEAKGWLTQYNIHTVFSNPVYVESATSEVNRYKMELQYIKDDMRRAMKDVFDVYTVEEWEYTFIRPAEMKIQALWNTRQKLLRPNVWPRRPIVLDDEQDKDLDI